MSDLVSILIPNYNKAPYLRETLDSILAQTYPHWECIVVDDHSTDTSWEILEEYAARHSRFKIHKRPNYLPKGGNGCRNYAFILSKGEFVQWFDSDDIMVREFVEIKVNSLGADNSIDAVISKMVSFENDLTNAIYKEWIPEYNILKIDYLLKDIQFVTSGPMIKKAFLLNKKLFNVNLKIGQDTEFFYRLVLADMKVCILSNVLTNYRISANSILGSYKNKKNTTETNYQYLLMIKSIVNSKSIPIELNTYINSRMFKFLRLIIHEKSLKYLHEWLIVYLLFLIYKKSIT